MLAAMENSAVAYFANGHVIIAPVVRTTTGLGLEIEPRSLGASPDINATGAALAAALASSKRIISHPSQDEWKGFFAPFQSAAGVRSYKAFMKEAKRVSVRVIDDHLKLTPQRNLGSKEGFEPIPDEAVVLSLDDMSAAGANLLGLLGIHPKP